MPYRISFVVESEEEAKFFVEDAKPEYEGDPAVVSWNDIEGELHEWDVTDVKYEKIDG